MSIHQELLNFDKGFSLLRKPPLFINDIAESSEQEKTELKKKIFTEYSGDLLSNIPTCECGEITGQYNIGVHCANCNTEVTNSVEAELEPILWVRAPVGVPKLMNPTVWTLLSARFKVSSFNIIRWLCDTSYTGGDSKVPDRIDELTDRGVQRGYNFFCENFDFVMEVLFTSKLCGVKRGKTEVLQTLLAKYRDCIFSSYLPLPNKSLMIIEKTNVGTYADSVGLGAIDAILTLVGIDVTNNPETFTDGRNSEIVDQSTPVLSTSIRTRQNRVAKTIDKLADFYVNYYRTSLQGWGGLFRKHKYASRAHFCFRAVISSITNRHRYDEIHIPWGIGISVFRLHLINKLSKLGYMPNQAIQLLNASAQSYNVLLDKLFKEIIAEAANGLGCGCLMQRNPSLERGSAQLVYITQVKDYVKIPTVSISILVVKGLNA
jgi:hypothetical protein